MQSEDEDIQGTDAHFNFLVVVKNLKLIVNYRKYVLTILYKENHIKTEHFFFIGQKNFKKT